MFLPMSIGWRIGLSAGFHEKTTSQISTKLGWRMGLGLEWTPLTFGADPGKVLRIWEVFLTVINTARH